MNSFEQEIAEALDATGSFEKEAALKLISVPPDTSHGNFTIPCFSLAKVMRKAPKMIAEDLAAQVKLPAGLSKVEAVKRSALNPAVATLAILLEITSRCFPCVSIALVRL